MAGRGLSRMTRIEIDHVECGWDQDRKIVHSNRKMVVRLQVSNRVRQMSFVAKVIRDENRLAKRWVDRVRQHMDQRL